MKETKTTTKDPICGMRVDEATAFHAERDGKTFSFCSDHCRQAVSVHAHGAKQRESLVADVDKTRTLPTTSRRHP